MASGGKSKVSPCQWKTSMDAGRNPKTSESAASGVSSMGYQPISFRGQMPIMVLPAAMASRKKSFSATSQGCASSS